MGVPVVVESWVSLKSLPPKEAIVLVVLKVILAVVRWAWFGGGDGGLVLRVS
jgi:hypothetical protein